MARYTVKTDQYYETQEIIPDNCNAILFHNTGNVPATINAEPIAPGEVIANSGIDWRDIDQGEYQLVFDDTGVLAPAPEITVRRKFYDLSAQ